jgi:putative transposase
MPQSSTSAPVSLPTRHVIRQLLQTRIADVVTEVIEEELTELLGSSRYTRTEGRRGYRNGRLVRTVTTEAGPMEIAVPRARVRQEDGSTGEFRSEILPRYARRTRRVDDAILGAYLAGANTRRIRKALAPLLGEQHLSRSAISRVVGRLKDQFATWSRRDLSEERYPVVFLDAVHLKVRLAKRVVSAPVLVALGADEEGVKRVLSLRLAVTESGTSWREFIEDLATRGLAAPRLLVSDGHAGIRKAAEVWAESEVQRCTVHKWANLREHCPAHARNDLRRDYDAIIYAGTHAAARSAYQVAVAKWRTHCAPVARSLEEAGEHLITFTRFPKPLWRAIRSTNAIENLNREFRRRTKTQGSFTTEESALTLLYGLIAFEQIRMQKIDGYRHLPQILDSQQVA